MDIITLALGAASSLFSATSALLEPVAGDASAALAIVLVTLGIRTVLIPVGLSSVRADLTRRRLAPRLAVLRRRWSKSPQRLATETRELYRAEHVSPFAGVLPSLAQLPVLSAVYGVFTHPVIGGAANTLLAAGLANVPLGTSLLASFSVGPTGVLVAVAVLAAVVVIGLLSRRQAVGWALERTRTTDLLSWLALASAVFALFAPLAAGVYLVVSQGWALAERAIMRRALA